MPDAVPLAARASRGDDRLLPPPAARFLAFLLLATFGAHHWMLMLEPAAPHRAWYAVGAGAVVAAGLLIAGRLGRRLLALPAVAGGAALAVLGAGAGDELLAPDRWGELAAGIQRGLEGLPGARVPYRGLDEWLRYVIALGGTGLTVLAAALAFWPRRRRAVGRPGAAVVALVMLYAVPAVSLVFDGEFIRGAVLAVLVLAFLRLERLRRRDAPAAAIVGAGAAALALAVAPALDRLDPWWDYENWALSTAASRSTTFSWEHDYGPLQWPRDGRELLRVRSPARTYWKADQLDVFNGLAWARDQSVEGTREALSSLTDGVPDELVDRWTVRIRVAVRNLQSDTFVTAGSLKDVLMPRKAELPTARAGVYRANRTLRRGDAYDALVYVPRPSERQLREAGTEFGGARLRYTRVGVRTGGNGLGMGGQPRTTTVDVRGFGAQPTRASLNPLAGFEPAGDLLESSEIARPQRLARRLLARSPTPYDYVERVESYLGRGFRYTEAPPSGSETLDGFLFDTRAGYCQQFSGAMALLLRLAGIPARVAVGFSPGSYDEDTREYIVRDTDAHSWVEVWFPGIGWVARDPTPSSAPPRSQASDLAPSAALGDGRDIGTTTLPGEIALADEGRNWTWTIVGGVLGAGLAFLLVRGAIRTRRRWRAGALLELERALRIAGSGPAPGTTLAELERDFAAWPPAAAYVRALRAQRFSRAATGPTREQRRGLRRALGAGGPVRRLRAWWALPPRLH